MPDILTRADKPLQIGCQFCNFRGNAEEGAWHRKTTGHLIRVEPSESPQNAQKVSEAILEAKNQSSADSESVAATPETVTQLQQAVIEHDADMARLDRNTLPPLETITISLPALRAVVLGLLDDGRTKGQLNLPWFFYRSPSTADIAVRLDFCDELEKRLRQLPARG